MLEALSQKTHEELRFFELVYIQDQSDLSQKSTHVYLCIGLKSVYFVKQNLASLRKELPKVEYENLEKVVEDTSSANHFLILVGGLSSMGSVRLLITSEFRTALLDRMAICYIADGMSRLGKTVTFPRAESNLNGHTDWKMIKPFRNYQHISYHDYGLFLHSAFKDIPNAVARTKTGSYRCPASTFFGSSNNSASRTGKDDSGMDVVVNLHVYDPVPLEHLEKIGRNHIRWVAMEYKRALIKNQVTYVIRNQMYLKKMNLSNDVSTWTGWELMLKEKDFVTVVILLRRQYMPPMVDSAQDFAIIFKCPNAAFVDEGSLEEQEFALLYECRIAADTFGPLVQNMTLYLDLIQAKLDALLFDEEAYSWILSRLKLKPDGLTEIEKFALIFLKGILKILTDENAIANPSILADISHRVNLLCKGAKSVADMDPISVARKKLYAPMEGIRREEENDDKQQEGDPREHAWHARVATYLAHFVDGGCLGSKFTLADMIRLLVKDEVTKQGKEKLSEILTFLVHVRPKDLKKKWSVKELQYQLMDDSFAELTFNDRVMQVMLELGYLRKVMDSTGDGSGGAISSAATGSGMSVQYASLLGKLLASDASSVNLKASICRQVIATKNAEQAVKLCPGLITLMRPGELFLSTYSTAALVNLSQAQETVKNFLMSQGVATLCHQQLKSKDDDLVLYTLVLLVHLTKSEHHRTAIKQTGMIPILIDILISTYGVAKAIKYKRRVLAELCSVIGQMCNDDEVRSKLCEKSEVLDCLLYVFEQSSSGTQVISKVLFALKQLCANVRGKTSEENKDQVGCRVIKPILEDLAQPKSLENMDWATNALMLLMLLVVTKKNCQRMKECGWTSAKEAIERSYFGKMAATRDRINQIEERIRMHKS